MFANFEDIKKRIVTIKSEIKGIEVSMKTVPEGELICAKNGTNYKWYLKGKDGYKYIYKKNLKLAKALAVKKYNIMREKDLYAELDACNAYMRKAEQNGENAEQILNHNEYQRLIGDGITSFENEIKMWRDAQYEKNTSHLEKLNIRGTQGKFLRSKSEAIIDNALYNAGVPFHYEEKLELKNVIFYPDFTIKHPRSGKIYYWEHLGMMDNKDYISNACMKLRTYCENGLIPSVDLILTYETKEHPLGTDEVQWIVNRYFK